MAWTVAVVIALLGISSLLVFLNKSFDKSKQGIKIFLTLFAFASIVLLAQVIKLIIQDKASASMQTNLALLSTSTLTLTIVLFSFFTMYFMITYLTGVFRAIRDSKQEKEELSWNGMD